MLINTWPTMLSRQWEAFNEKKTALVVSCCRVGFTHTKKWNILLCLLLLFSLSQTVYKLYRYNKVVVISLLFFARLIFPERGPWHQTKLPTNSNGKILKKIFTWRLPPYEYLILKSGLLWRESMPNFAGVAKKIPVKSQVLCHFEWRNKI